MGIIKHYLIDKYQQTRNVSFEACSYVPSKECYSQKGFTLAVKHMLLNEKLSYVILFHEYMPFIPHAFQYGQWVSSWGGLKLAWDPGSLLETYRQSLRLSQDAMLLWNNITTDKTKHGSFFLNSVTIWFYSASFWTI